MDYRLPMTTTDLLTAAFHLIERRWAPTDSTKDHHYCSDDTQSHYVSAVGALRKLYVDDRPAERITITPQGPFFYAAWDLLDKCATDLFGDHPQFKIRGIHAPVGYSALDRVNAFSDQVEAKEAVLDVYRTAIFECDGTIV